MAAHSKYWSCSPLADWIRGTKKLSAGTSEDWDNWTTRAQIKHNFRYWLAEEALDRIQDFVTAPANGIYSVKYYINNRWVSRTHSLTAHSRDIKPGNWSDVGSRFLPCLFNELVDFVEIETAWMQVAWGNADAREKYKPPFYASGWFRWRTWRCPQAGLDHLDWSISLTMNEEWGVAKDDPKYGTPTSQSVNATEIKALYTWWTTTYRNRPDPYDASGYTAHFEAMRVKRNGKIFGSLNDEDTLARNRASDLLHTIETAYKDEDTAMLKRLIDIRESLWT